jgi:hypothetical protein
VTDEARRHKVRVLSAIEATADDPTRLLQAAQGATDDEDAVRRVGEAYGVDAELARVLLDLRFGSLSGSARARRADELRVLRAEWGPPIRATLTLTGRAGGVLAVDGAEHRFRAAGRQALTAEIHAFLCERFARPRLRPVVVTGPGAADGPVHWTVLPDGSGWAGDAGDPPSDRR